MDIDDFVSSKLIIHKATPFNQLDSPNALRASPSDRYISLWGLGYTKNRRNPKNININLIKKFSFFFCHIHSAAFYSCPPLFVL